MWFQIFQTFLKSSGRCRNLKKIVPSYLIFHPENHLLSFKILSLFDWCFSLRRKATSTQKKLHHSSKTLRRVYQDVLQSGKHQAGTLYFVCLVCLFLCKKCFLEIFDNQVSGRPQGRHHLTSCKFLQQLECRTIIPKVIYDFKSTQTSSVNGILSWTTASLILR